MSIRTIGKDYKHSKNESLFFYNRSMILRTDGKGSWWVKDSGLVKDI
jgi:hypothetical protein